MIRIAARPTRRWPERQTPLGIVLRAVLAAGFLVVAPAGCGGVRTQQAWIRNAIQDHQERREALQGLSGESAVVLERHGLLVAAANDPAGTARALEAALAEKDEPDGALALAEVSYHAGLEQQPRSPEESILWYRDAASLATLAISDPNSPPPARAVDIHNQALKRIIRVAREAQNRQKRPWQNVLIDQNMVLGSSTPFLAPQQISSLKVASDIRVQGIDHIYEGPGLGVPLVAHRLEDPESSDPHDRFMPREIRTAATAVLKPGGGLLHGDWRKKPPKLVLFDPFQDRTIELGGHALVLANDRSTPLAVQVARGRLATLEWVGLLQPEFQRIAGETGIYMLRPYQPGKIPVVLVHGLVSSPRAWVQTINELRNDPALDAYQFWVFLYPTGLPIPTSAARFRASLSRVRDVVDPVHTDPALDQMVLVGHSMGGLLSKMMAQDSQLTLWDATIRVPNDQFKAPPELRAKIDQALVYEPVPYVRRVVFIASPHRGSPIANAFLGRTISRMVRRNDELDDELAVLTKLNGPNVVSDDIRGKSLNAINNLRTDSPILAAVDSIPIDPKVPYHSIIPQIGGPVKSDGVVQYVSSHLEGATSEQIVWGTHFSQERPEVTQELKRILLEHLATPPPTLARSKDPDPPR